MRILFLAARLPTELLRGYEARAFHQIRLLSQRHRVTLVAYTSGAAPTVATRRLYQLCESVFVVPLRPIAMITAALRCGFGRGLPLQTAMYALPSMQHLLQGLVRDGGFDLAHVQLARLAHVFDAARGSADERRRTLPCVIDLIDSLSLNMQRRATLDHGAPRIAARFEASRLGPYERLLCDRFDRALVVSRVDAQAIGAHPNLVVNPDGVVLDTVRAPVRREPNRILFSGNLGYFPNVDAITWFVHEVLPGVRRDVPEVRVVIVGARPGRALRSLASVDRQIEVRGFVPDLAREIRRASVAVAPIRAGSGQPLKVLEAMAAGTAVVATPQAIAGIAVEHERHLLVAGDAATFAAMVVRLLRDSVCAERLARTARHFVEEHHGWEQSVAQLESIYADICAGGSR